MPKRVARRPGPGLPRCPRSRPAGEVTMRADNHQLVQPLYISTYSKVDGKDVKFDVERTGNGFKTDRRIEAKDTAQPTTCKMTRP